MGEWLLWDTESDDLLDGATKIHFIQIGTLEGPDVDIYADNFPGCRPLQEGLARLATAEKLIAHHSIGHDFPLMEKLYPGLLTIGQQIDTLLLARMKNPNERQNSLEDLGRRLGTLKGSFDGPWSTPTVAMRDYAIQDIHTLRAIWKDVREVMAWGACVATEHRFAWVIHLQQQNGFRLDLDAATSLEAELRQEVADETLKVRDVFPPRFVPLKEKGQVVVMTPKVNRPKEGISVGAPFSKIRLEVFNPASRAQVASRLQGLGWAPKAFGDDGVATVDEKVLAALPYPEAQQLVSLFTVMKKLGQLSDGKTGWLKLVKPTGKVHGRVNTTGCAPGRCSHSSPNLAQVNKAPRMRACWIPRPGWKLVGVDGEGLQARLLASYLTKWDGGAYANKIVNGDKKLRTDEHSSNLQHVPYLKAAFEFTDAHQFAVARDGVKRCLYAVLFGASDPSLGQYVKDALKEVHLPTPRLPNRELGALARQGLFRAIKGFQKLDQALTEAIKRGYLKGPDGRHVPIRSKHSKLVFLMQAGESAVMKLAATIFHFERAPAAGLTHGIDYDYCAHVHDEHQLEARPEVAALIGKTYADCIVEAGVRLGIRCPLAGSFDVGNNWSETH